MTVTEGDPSRLFAAALNRGDVIFLGAIVAYSSFAVFLRFKPPFRLKGRAQDDMSWESPLVDFLAMQMDAMRFSAHLVPLYKSAKKKLAELGLTPEDTGVVADVNLGGSSARVR